MLSQEDELKQEIEKIGADKVEQYKFLVDQFNGNHGVINVDSLREIRTQNHYQDLVRMGLEISPLLEYNMVTSSVGGITVFECLLSEIAGENMESSYNCEFFECHGNPF